jgi:hypothetical protein
MHVPNTVVFQNKAMHRVMDCHVSTFLGTGATELQKYIACLLVCLSACSNWSMGKWILIKFDNGGILVTFINTFLLQFS